jgi:hypothetical protein
MRAYFARLHTVAELRPDEADDDRDYGDGCRMGSTLAAMSMTAGDM